MNAAAIARDTLPLASEPLAIYPAAAATITTLIATPERFITTRQPSPPRSQHGRSMGDLPQSPRILPGGIGAIHVKGVTMREAGLLVRFGLATSTVQLAHDFRTLIGNDQVRSIVLVFDSPGGTAMGNEEAAEVIAAGRGRKPIEAVAVGMCASAAYYLAAAADRITTLPSALVGSIGSMLVQLEIADALEKFGIGANVIKFGLHKADGNQFEKLSDSARKALQEVTDAYGKQFVESVARHRGITPAAVRERYGDGKVFIGTEAHARGLVDAVGTLESVIGRLTGRSSSTVTASAPGLRFKIQAGTRLKLHMAGMIRSADRDCPERCAAAVADWYQQRGKPLPANIQELERDIDHAALTR